MSKSALKKYGWGLVFRGTLLIIFAILAVFWTKFTLSLLVIFFGIFVISDGVILVFSGLTGKSHQEDWWVHILRGILGILVGIFIFLWPEITAIIFVYLVGAWAVFIGITEFIVSAKWHEAISKSILIVWAIVSLIFGIIIMLFPLNSLITMIWIIGIFAFIFGIMLVTLGFQIESVE